MLTYIFDIDDTILSVKGHDFINAKPILERITKVNSLYSTGNRIIYWTARDTAWHAITLQQLETAGCLFHEFRTGKPHYDIWVDDKALNASEFFK